MPEGPPPDSKELGYYFTLAQVGLEMVAPLIVGLVIDAVLGTSPWLMLAGIIFGFVGGLTHIIMLTNKHDAEERRKRQQGNQKP